MTWTDLGKSKYVMLTSVKKDGTPVGVPVWAAADGDRIVVWTNPNTWKVKRIRRNPAVTLQACDARGGKLHGDVIAGRAEIQGEEDTERTRDVVARKYGVIGVVLVKGHKLVRGRGGSVGIAITEAD